MSRWAAVTFAEGIDRRAAARDVARALERQGLRLAGFLQRQRPDDASGALELERLGEKWGQAAFLGARSSAPEKQPVPISSGCSFAFEPAGFERGRQWLEEDAKGADVLFVDELSKLELEGAGHAAALRWALAEPGEQVVVFCTAAKRLTHVVDRFRFSGQPVAYLEYGAVDGAAREFAARVAAALGVGHCGHE